LLGRPIAATGQPLLNPPNIDSSTASDTDRRDVAALNQLKTQPVLQAGCLREFRNRYQFCHDLLPNRPVLPDQGVGDVYLGFAFHSLRRVTSGIEYKLLGVFAQKLDAAPVSDPYKQVKVQGECFGTRKDSAAAAVLIPELDHGHSADDHLL